MIASLRNTRRRASPPALPGGPATGYHSTEALNAALTSLADAYEHVTLETWGESVAGVPILAVRVGQDPSSGAPALRVLGGHHGDERASVELALRIAEALAEHDDDPRVAWIRENATTWVAPLINPDGMDQGSRYNGRGIDLNRNYGHEWQDGFASGAAPFSEPETRAVRTHGLWQRPALSLSLHSGAENLGWPWNYTTDAPLDSQPLEALADTYGAAYPGELWMVQGADWYITRGDTNDWSYGTYGGLDFTVEVSVTKSPPASELPAVFERHLSPSLELLAAPPTLSVSVRDAETNAPIEAVVTPSDGAPRVSNPVAGTVHIYASEPPESVRVEAPGYAAVEVQALETDDLTVALTPASLSASPWTPHAPPYLGPVTLTRPGLPSVSGTSGPDGLEPATALLAGPWTIVADDGTTWPHTHWVDDPTSPAISVTVTERGRVWLIEGDGIEHTSAAVVRRGRHRHAEAVPFDMMSDGTLRVDVGQRSGVADVNILVGGNWVRATAVGTGAWLDTSDPTDTGAPPPPLDTGGSAGRSCGCTQSGPSSLGWLAFAFLLAPLRRQQAQ